MSWNQQPPTLESLVLIPPILDCIVTYLHTIDLLAWSSTTRNTRHCVLGSQAAWRAISFYTPSKSFERRENSTSVYDSTIAVRSHHNGGTSPTTTTTRQSRWNVSSGNSSPSSGMMRGSAGKAERCLSVDDTLTVLGRMMPLGLYTSIDLSRTKADKHLLRDLLDHCQSLRYLILEDCPNVRVGDIVVGLYGVEKKFLKRWREEVEEEDGVGAWEGTGEMLSLVAEVMGRMAPRVDGKGDGAKAAATASGGAASVSALSRLTHVHTKEVRDGLFRLHELKDGVRSEVIRVMSKMEDVYTYPDMPDRVVLRKRAVQLREIRTDMKLHRTTYNGPGWLERLAYSQGDYLFMLCHLMGINLTHTD